MSHFRPLISFAWKALRKCRERLLGSIYAPITHLILVLNGVTCGSGLKCSGIIKLYVTRRGRVQIGENFHVNSGANHNVIGRQGRCIFWVEGELSIGDDVGISNSALICRNRITIADHVVIGGNCVIYDTDFHPIDPGARLQPTSDLEQAGTAPVAIENNVFIGAHSTILKGVTIGENSVVGACSLVTKSIPPNEVWGGNPAKMLKQFKSEKE
jgi:acetyltransferase-like isoleucine patch superfamily enzyme